MGEGHRGRGHWIYPGEGHPKTGDIPGEKGIPIGTGLIGCIEPGYIVGDIGWTWETGVGGPRDLLCGPWDWEGCGEEVGLNGDAGRKGLGALGFADQLPGVPYTPGGLTGCCDIFCYSDVFTSPRQSADIAEIRKWTD